MSISVRNLLLSLAVAVFFLTGNTGSAADMNVHISQVDISSCPTIKSMVIVTDNSGAPVGDLTEANFTVKEDSVAQSPISVTPADQASAEISVVLCLDYSSSMSATAISDMENAAVTFINQMDVDDAGEIIKFADGFRVSQTFTTDKEALVNAVQGELNLSTGATSLYDATFQAVQDISMRAGRKAIIAMTDGHDNNSARSDSEIINLAIANDVPVFTIGLGASINRAALENIANQTRGIYYEAPSSGDLQAIYESLSQMLNNQYIVSHKTRATDGLEHDLEITATIDTASGSDSAAFVSCGPFDQGIYIDQTNGRNTSTTAGTATDPFKSITYAMLTMASRNTPDPWMVHIRAGIYDANPAKPANEREIFPIELRDGIVFQGDAGAANCIISGAFNPESNSALLRGENLDNIAIKNLTLKDMYRSGGSHHGAGCELINCTGIIQGCVIENNRLYTNDSNINFGSGMWMSIPSGGVFDIIGNIVKKNGASDFDLNPYSNYRSSGGGFYVSGNYTGIVSENTFSENVSWDQPAYGGGFLVNGNFNGDMTGNSFLNNRVYSGWPYTIAGGGFFISGGFTGNITGNVFDGNQCSGDAYSGSKGGGFYIGNSFSGNIIGNTFNNNSILAYDFSYGAGFFVGGTLAGDVSENSFSKNSSSDAYYVNSCGGGFYITGDLSSNIRNNCFNENYVSFNGGGFHLEGNFSGNIDNNTFIRNSARKTGGAFYLTKRLNANITKNVFSSNISESSSCFILNYDGSVSNSQVVANNFFLYNRLKDDAPYAAVGLYSKQNITLINNTFYGDRNLNGYQVGISSSAAGSVIRNNIFENLHTAIWEQDEQNLVITNNSVYNLENILYRNSQPMGGDSDFLALLFSNYRNNPSWDAGIVGESAATGTWTQRAFYDKTNNYTVFTDSNKSWTGNQWLGAMLNLSNIPNNRWHYKIVGNTEHQLFVHGNIEVTGLGRVGASYAIDDYRLRQGSPNIDSGIVTAVVTDFKGTSRPQGGAFDIGADEFFMGGMPPAVSPASPATTSVTKSSAVLKADINPNNLVTTGLFEYGTTTAYGTSTSRIDIGSDTAIHTVIADIASLTPDTTYHFRFRAQSSTGETLGPDQTFRTTSATATISGRISISIAGDPDLSAANVTVSLKNTGYSATTGADGQFTMGNVAPGSYVIVVSAPFMMTVQQPVTLTEGQNFSLNLPSQLPITQADISQSVAAKDAVIEAQDQEIEALLQNMARFDVGEDGQIGLPEAINALQTISGIRE